MDPSEEALGAPAGTVMPQELLEEMLWVFRVEDASAWNYSILALTAVVVIISMALLVRSIQANRKRKLQPEDKEPSETLYLEEAGSKEDNSLNHLRETLLSEKPNLTQVGTESTAKDEPVILFPEPPESKSY
ncbi:organic solute transporter subunit beta [Ctenodactylus gundi]